MPGDNSTDYSSLQALKNNCRRESVKFVFAPSAMSPRLPQSEVSWCRRCV